MHPEQLCDMAKYRMNEKHAEAERRRLVGLAIRERPTLRARAARRFFEVAVALDREEKRRIVWERLEARGRP